jgi:hypothetical protein
MIANAALARRSAPSSSICCCDDIDLPLPLVAIANVLSRPTRSMPEEWTIVLWDEIIALSRREEATESLRMTGSAGAEE